MTAKSESTRPRNHSIDCLKILCAFLVVLLHSEPAYKEITRPITRCAVPCFFIISGYFLYSACGTMQPRLMRSARRMAHCLTWSTIIYLPLRLWQCSKTADFSCFGLDGIADFLFFNENPVAGHLWYVSAYLYVLLALWFVCRADKLRWLFCLVPVLLMTDLVLGKYSLLLWHREFGYLYVRNWLFVGLPYTAVGMLVRKMNFRPSPAKTVVLMGGVILFSITTLLEKSWLESIRLSAPREHFLSTTFLALCLFLLALSLAGLKGSRLSAMGRDDSLNIYIFHMWAAFILSVLVARLPASGQECYLYAKPLCVFALSLLFSHLFRRQRWISL